MSSLIKPEGYSSPLTIRETEVAIKEVKDHFERSLAKSLHLEKIRSEALRIPFRRRALYRYECHPPG